MYDYEIVGDVYRIPLVDIYVDPKFNCRRFFTAQQVHTLGQDIKEEGQLQPIIIQPMDDVIEKERPDPCTWKFRLIAGHRRYMAIDYWTDDRAVNCCVKTGLTYEQAKILNLTENLQREDLNMLEGAESIVTRWPRYEVKDIARFLGQSKRWVQVRFDLLGLPEYVQRKAATGELNQYDIETLAGLEEYQIESAFQQLIKTKRTRGRSPIVRKRRPWLNRPRGKGETGTAIAFLFEHYSFAGLSTEDNDKIVSALAWTSRAISSEEFFEKRLGFPAGCVIVDEDDKVVGLNNED